MPATAVKTPTMSNEQIQAILAENAKLKAQVAHKTKISFKVSPKGAVSVYGLGRFPVTLYGEQWTRLMEQRDALTAFIEANKAALSTKE